MEHCAGGSAEYSKDRFTTTPKFGTVAMTDECIIVGAPGAKKRSFIADATRNWKIEPVATLTGDDNDKREENFGAAVGISKQFAIVSAPEETKAFIYKQDADGAWPVSPVVTLEGINEGMAYGSTVAINSKCHIGASGDEKVYL